MGCFTRFVLSRSRRCCLIFLVSCIALLPILIQLGVLQPKTRLYIQTRSQTATDRKTADKGPPSVHNGGYSKPEYLKPYIQINELSDELNATDSVQRIRGAADDAASDAAENADCPLTMCNNGTCFENLVCHKPFKFLENYKNPCFYEEVN